MLSLLSSIVFWTIAIWLLLGLLKTIIFLVALIIASITDKEFTLFFPSWEDFKTVMILIVINILAGPIPILAAIA